MYHIEGKNGAARSSQARLRTAGRGMGLGFGGVKSPGAESRSADIGAGRLPNSFVSNQPGRCQTETFTGGAAPPRRLPTTPHEYWGPALTLSNAGSSSGTWLARPRLARIATSPPSEAYPGAAQCISAMFIPLTRRRESVSQGWRIHAWEYETPIVAKSPPMRV